jgi:predicted ester cyclase
MPSPAEARQFAQDWIAAWNARDLDRILGHYTANIVLTSPAAAHLHNDPSGTVNGIADLRSYFERGLRAFPDLHFEFIDVLCGVSSIVVVFRNQRGTRTAEYMELDRDGKVVRVVANYGD